MTSPPESVPFFGSHGQFWLRLNPPHRAVGLPFVSWALLHCPSEMRLIERDGIDLVSHLRNVINVPERGRCR